MVYDIYDIIYLTAIGLPPGGSSTVHTHKQYIEQHNLRVHKQYTEQHNRHKQYIEQHYIVFPDDNVGFPINIHPWGIVSYLHSYNVQ
jgi:hypothetical protein